jgi:hypothetical protein
MIPGAVSNPENAREGMAQEAVQALSGRSGGEFGKGYVEAQLCLHDRLVDLCQTQALHTPDRELATLCDHQPGHHPERSRRFAGPG